MRRLIFPLKLLFLLLSLTSALYSYSQSYGYVGDYIYLSSPSIPYGATDKGSQFSSSDSELLVYSSGSVKILKYFTGTRTVKCDTYYLAEVGKMSDGTPIMNSFHFTTSFSIACNSISLSGIPSNLSLTVGNGYWINWSYYPSSKTQPTVDFESSNNSVAYVSSSGYITAVGEGFATITIKNSSGPNSQISLTVTEDDKIKLSAEPSGGTVELGKKVKLTAKAAGKVITDARIYYTTNGSTPTSSSTLYTQEGITIGDDCTIKAIAYKTGLKTSDVLSLNYKVKPEISLPTAITMLPKSSYQLTPTIVPLSVANKGVTWTSSDPDVVTVNSSGLASVLKNGSYFVTITCTLNDGSGISASCNVYVLKDEGSGHYTYIEHNSDMFVYEIVDDSKKTCRLTLCIPYTGNVNIPPVTMELYKVVEIGNGAFCNEYNLDVSSITIPNSVTIIGDYAFSGCSNLSSISIPRSVTTIGDYAFRGCSNLSSISIPNSVATIGDYAFENCRNLSRISIPNSVTTIGDYAFQNCRNLTSVSIPSSVTSIGVGAFSGCYNFTSITVDSDNNVYDSRDNCNAIIRKSDNALIMGCNTTTIPSGVTAIGEGAFSMCYYLTSINIPSSVTSIGDDAFYECSNLTSINLPSCVTSIGDGAFSRCSNLTSFNIPSGVTSIGDEAFRGCYGLTTITIPNSVTTIGDEAFWCNSLTSINIPSSVTSIGENAFYGCSDLTSITVDSDNNVYDSRDNCNAIIRKADNTLLAGCKTTIIPSSVTSIGEDAFSECDGLTTITIPNSVTTIGDNAFFWCYDLTSITIPSSVTSIGDDALYGCNKLTTVVVGNASPVKIGSYVFSNRENATLYVPKGSKEAYEAADYWKEFKEIVEYDTEDDYILGDVNGNGGVDIGDAVSIVNYLVGKQSETFIMEAADTNKNGGIDIGDAVTIVNFLVGKTASLSRSIDIEEDEKELQ